MASATVDVVIETGQKRVFASALYFPGWSRSGRSEDDAIAALVAAVDRYAVVAALAGVTVPGTVDVRVIERVPGNATTDFGAPAIPAASESQVGTAAQRTRRTALVQACWQYFDSIAGHAPEELRKGPRGGGRDTSKVIEHVHGAEDAYKGKLGIRGVKDPAEIRALMIDAIISGRSPDKVGQWPAAYAARRIAWHVLDHAWEIEDRSQ
jgi:hypothetical protein